MVSLIKMGVKGDQEISKLYKSEFGNPIMYTFDTSFVIY